MALLMLTVSLAISLSAAGQASHLYEASGRINVSTSFCLAADCQENVASLLARLLALRSLCVRVCPQRVALTDRWPARSLASVTTLTVECRSCQ